jgi:hypothetical protein
MNTEEYLVRLTDYPGETVKVSHKIGRRFIVTCSGLWTNWTDLDFIAPTLEEGLSVAWKERQKGSWSGQEAKDKKTKGKKTK